MKKSPLKKKSKKMVAMSKLDNAARELCYRRGKCELEGYWGLECSKKMDWAHLKSRRYPSLRWNEKNAMLLCASHHFASHNHPDLFTQAVEELYPGRWDYLNNVLKTVTKVDRALIYAGLKEMLEQ